MRSPRALSLSLAILGACRADHREPKLDRAQDLLLSGEVALDAPTTGAADGTQTARDVSFDGTRWFAVWSDSRTGPNELRGSRVDASGAPLDGQGTVLASTATSARVAWDGAAHVVVFAAGGTIFARPVGADGVPGATVSLGAGSNPAIASSGDGAMIAWISGPDVITRPRSKTGALGAPVTLGVAGAGPRLAWDGARYALVYPLAKDLLGLHLDAAGAAVESTPVTLYTTSSTVLTASIDVACGGGVCLTGARESGRLSLARWTAANVVSAGPTRTGFGNSPLAMAWDGTSFHAIHGSAIAVAEDVRVDAAGALLGAATLEPQVEAVECASGCLALVTNGYDAGAVRISGATVLDARPKVVALGTNHQQRPAVAFDGTRYLAVWTDSRGDGADLYGVRLDASGAVLDGVALKISDAPGAQRDPAVAFDGASFVVVWVDNRAGGSAQHLYGARVSPLGTVLDPAGVPIVTAPDVSVASPAIATRAGESFVAFSQSTASATSIGGTRVDDKLARVDATPIPVSTGGAYDDSPAVAFNGSTWLVAWQRGFGSPHLYSTTVSTAGVVGATRALSSTTGAQRSVSLGARGSTFLAAWIDGTTAYDVRYARLDASGALLDAAPGVALATASTVDALPIVVDDGASFFVSWHELASSSATSTVWHGAFVGVDGGRPPPTLLTESLAGSVSGLRAAATGNGARLLVYQRADDGLRAQRARARLHTGRENGRACATGADCLSTFCADGVCCESACTDQCAACNEAASRGRCVAISGAPRPGHPACSAVGAGTPCAARCDGVGTTACVFAASSVSCGVASCAAGVETHVASCDGAGQCADTPTSCGAYACGATTCKSSCTAKSDCAAGHYCKDGACTVIEGLGTTCTAASACASGFCVDGVCCEQASCGAGAACNTAGGAGVCKKLAGTACAAAGECATGVCVDGVCCDRACEGQCEACDVAGAAGKCTPVAGAPHGKRLACDDGGGDPCKARRCDGATDATRCVGHVRGAETACRAATCADASFTPASFCDGAGACKAAEPTSCVPYACSDAGCRTSCAQGDDCAGGYQCVEGRCVTGARCVEQGAASRGVDGAVTPCAPFRCGGDGKCASACATSADCAAGHACNTATARCEPTAPAGSSEDSGGCHVGRASNDALAAAVLVLAASFARASRRRRMRDAGRAR